jgi:hypothetical protein
MGRKLLRGVIAGLAAVATLYAFGAAGLLVRRVTGHDAVTGFIAWVGLVAAVGVGVAVLRYLSKRGAR